MPGAAGEHPETNTDHGGEDAEDRSARVLPYVSDAVTNEHIDLLAVNTLRARARMTFVAEMIESAEQLDRAIRRITPSRPCCVPRAKELSVTRAGVRVRSRRPRSSHLRRKPTNTAQMTSIIAHCVEQAI